MSNLKMAKVLNAFNTETNTIAIDSEQLIRTVDKSIDLGASTNVYSTVSSLPTLAQAFSKALVTDTNTLYQYNGGWYPIALINNFNPTFVIEPDATYALNKDGSATTVTVLAADSDDVPIVYSVVTDSDFNQFATCTHDSDKHNVWTITPSVSSGVFPAGTVTFRASDGVNLANVNSEFSINFGPPENILYAANGGGTDHFGHDVSINSDGTYAIVGAYNEDSGGTNAGAAYVFTRSGSTWTQQQMLYPGVNTAGDQFGYSVSINSDGTYAIVGSNKEDDAANSQTDAGAAYIFSRSGSTWTQQQKIQASDRQTQDYFGFSVSISSDGNYAIVGAYGEDTGGAFAGAAYIFSRSGSTWTQQQKIQASDVSGGSNFGSEVSINSDGTYVIVGAQQEDTIANDAGAAYIFTRSGSTWTQQAKLTASDAQASDFFGISVSISSDGNYAVCGAWDNGGAGDPLNNAGAAYVFTRSGSTWTQQAKLTASDAQANDFFGNYRSVSLNSDGTYVVVGATYEDGGAGDPLSGAGAAYVFTRSGSTWTEQQKITASDADASDNFGGSVSISKNELYVIAGAHAARNASNVAQAGAAYIYDLS